MYIGLGDRPPLLGDLHEAVRIEIIAMAGNAPPSTTHAEAGHRRYRAPDGRDAYDRAANGAPCVAWNHDPDSCAKASRGAEDGAHIWLLRRRAPHSGSALGGRLLFLKSLATRSAPPGRRRQIF